MCDNEVIHYRDLEVYVLQYDDLNEKLFAEKEKSACLVENVDMRISFCSRHLWYHYGRSKSLRRAETNRRPIFESIGQAQYQSQIGRSVTGFAKKTATIARIEHSRKKAHFQEIKAKKKNESCQNCEF